MFLNPLEFEFTAHLETNWKLIQEEYLELSQTVFDPWIQRDLHNDGWGVYGLIVLGEKVESACKQCPHTIEVLDQIPGINLAGFSRLAPHTHVQPHTGWAISSNRFHLGLVIPPACNLRVANEVREWQEGKCLVFDDTVEHEAWNNSDEVRAVLLIDILRPGIQEVADVMSEEILEYAGQLLQR
jgi:ornithine lipid ester-linked acyl 2-hydroxylase